MESRPIIQKFRALQLKRLECLRKHKGKDSPEEDGVLDEMDEAWWALSEEEQAHIRDVQGPSHAETILLIGD